MNVSLHQLLAILALILAVLSVLPIPNLRPTWTLALAVLLLALLQFVSAAPSRPGARLPGTG